MEAKEKAKDLFDKMHEYQEGYQTDDIMLSKRCAIVAVDEIIEAEHRIWEKVSHIAYYKSYDKSTDFIYWQQVKEEINSI